MQRSISDEICECKDGVAVFNVRPLVSVFEHGHALTRNRTISKERYVSEFNIFWRSYIRDYLSEDDKFSTTLNDMSITIDPFTRHQIRVDMDNMNLEKITMYKAISCRSVLMSAGSTNKAMILAMDNPRRLFASFSRYEIIDTIYNAACDMYGSVAEGKWVVVHGLTQLYHEQAFNLDSPVHVYF